MPDRITDPEVKIIDVYSAFPELIKPPKEAAAKALQRFIIDESELSGLSPAEMAARVVELQKKWCGKTVTFERFDISGGAQAPKGELRYIIPISMDEIRHGHSPLGKSPPQSRSNLEYRFKGYVAWLYPNPSKLQSGLRGLNQLKICQDE